MTIAKMDVTRRDLALLACAALTAPAFGQDAPIVFAAASLKPVLDEISSRLAPMRLSYGGSGALARQIMRGAPADLYLSANRLWMNEVVAARAIGAADRRDLLGNRLVLVGAAGQDAIDLSDWSPDGRIATGFVEAVPVGQYAKAALQGLGLWDVTAPLLVETENVRAALALVARGELPYAIVYRSDALSEPSVTTLAEFPEELHPEIIYPMARLSPRGTAPFERLAGPDAAEVFAAYGFRRI